METETEAGHMQGHRHRQGERKAQTDSDRGREEIDHQSDSTSQASHGGLRTGEWDSPTFCPLVQVEAAYVVIVYSVAL